MKGKYVDGFVITMPKKNLEAYKKMAKEGARLWKKYGALDYKECIGDDLNPDMQGVKIRTFPKMTKLKPDEIVVFSYILYKSRKHRDQVNKKVMSDPSMSAESMKDQSMPFTMNKMSMGGFEVIVSG